MEWGSAPSEDPGGRPPCPFQLLEGSWHFLACDSQSLHPSPIHHSNVRLCLHTASSHKDSVLSRRRKLRLREKKWLTAGHTARRLGPRWKAKSNRSPSAMRAPWLYPTCKGGWTRVTSGQGRPWAPWASAREMAVTHVGSSPSSWQQPPGFPWGSACPSWRSTSFGRGWHCCPHTSPLLLRE